MYVDAYENKDKGIIHVVERRNGKRKFVEYPADYSLYIPDEKGTYRGLNGEKLKKITPSSSKELQKIKSSSRQTQTFEANLNYVFRCLEQNYSHETPVTPNIAFFDIETSFDKDLGYSSPEDAFNYINAVSVYLQWMGQMVCIAIPPPGVSYEEAQQIADEVGDTIIVQTEEELLNLFLTLIEDADLLSGWNSKYYDIPYITNRIIKVLGKQEARRLCLWDRLPEKKYNKIGGKKSQTYLLYGRVHLDYLELYKKYNYEERASYALDYISERELNERKVPYDGTLDQLYRKDFKKFIEYSIQDTYLLDRLDGKLRYIDLAISIAHSNDVLIETAMGTVLMIEQAITSEAHRRGVRVPDADRTYQHSVDDDSDGNIDQDITERAAGGWVKYRKAGFHKWIASADLVSLYPSVIRTFNMSPETLVGQLQTTLTDAAIKKYVIEELGNRKNTASNRARLFAKWWNDRFCTLEVENFLKGDTAQSMKVTFTDGQSGMVTGAELRDIIFNSGKNWCITANGTIFETSVEGVIPGLLTRWFRERQDLQGIKGQINSVITGEFTTEYEIINEDALPADSVYEFRTDALLQTLETDDLKIIETFFKKWGLTTKDGKIYPNDQCVATWKSASAYWDKQQLVKKISLNSAYGGILNPHMKFFDQRIGQSTTLTGRSITKHMTAKTNELLCGEYDKDGECIIYNDTDSVYFSAWPAIKHEVAEGNITWDKDVAVEIYNQISDDVSNSFPEYLKKTWGVPSDLGKNIQSAREIIAETGLFIKKKRYACLVFDKDGKRKDLNGSPGEIKAMGIDSRRSDTSEFMQDFLNGILMDVLKEKPEHEVIENIKKFRLELESMLPWKMGTPKAVNNLTRYSQLQDEFMEKRLRGLRVSKPSIPGHVQASHNWNMLKEKNQDMFSMKIVDGQKIVVCDLKINTDGLTSVAYPIDEKHLPSWFLELPFDQETMINKILDQKLQNMIGVLKWDLDKSQVPKDTFDQFFG